MTIEVNYFSVLLAAVVSMVLGFVYYHPMVVGKAWMKEKGMSAEDVKRAQKEMGKWYGLSFVVALVTAYVLFHVMVMAENFFHYRKKRIIHPSQNYRSISDKMTFLSWLAIFTVFHGIDYIS